MPLDYPQRRQNLVYGDKSGFIGYLMVRPPGPWRMYWKTLEGLVLWYDFNRCQAIDLSGHGNNGTIYGAQCVQGRSGRALSFDGVDDYVEVPDNPSLDSPYLSVSAWIKTNVTPDEADDILRRVSPFALRITTSCQAQFHCLIDGTWYHADGCTQISLGEWHHIIGTFDGSTIRVYVDGVEDGNYSISGTIDSATHPLLIGKGAGGYGRYFNGTIDEVRIYNRALSEEEIKWLYEHT